MGKVIRGGLVYDPASGWEGERRDIYIRGGWIVPPFDDPNEIITATGQLVVAGGIDCRSQVATYGLHFLRVRGLVPSAREVGETYAALGYTHVHEPFLTHYTAGHIHRELAALPLVDTSASLVLNLRDLDVWLKPAERRAEVLQTINFLLEATRSLTLRVAEPFVRYRQDYFAHRTLKTEAALDILAELARGLGVMISLEASPEVLEMPLPDGIFHLGGLGPALHSAGLVEIAQAHLERGTSGDMGLIDTAQANMDIKPVNVDLGWFRPLELTPTAVPGAARRALKLALDYQGRNLAFSGADSYLAPVQKYTRLLGWLGNQESRARDFKDDLGGREFTLSDWVWATRTLPARLLGLADQGHLAPGARANIALFEAAPGARGRGLEGGHCHSLIKNGEKVIDNYHLVRPDAAKTTAYRPTGADPTSLLAEMCQYRSFRPENLWSMPHFGLNWKKV